MSHHQLLYETQQKAATVEEAIKNIQKVKQRLNQNVHEVKREISTVFSRQLEALRNREVWLLAQVEMIEAAKEEVLRQQQDGLCHTLGALTKCIEYSQDDASTTDSKKLNKRLSESIEQLEQVPLKPLETPHISFQSDVTELREVINSFGYVNSKGLPLEHAFVDPETSSASLPKAFEDYGDAEHLILYKTLSEINAAKLKDSSIRVHIPKLVNPGLKWLSYSEPETVVVNSPVPVPDPSFCYPLIRGDVPSQARSMQSIHQWLAEIKHGGEIEEDNDFELISGRTTTDGSGSIEIFEPKDPLEDLFHHMNVVKCQPTSAWLSPEPIQAEVPVHAEVPAIEDWLSKVHEKSTEVKGVRCGPCRGASTESLDIENLDDLVCCMKSGMEQWHDYSAEKEWLIESKEQNEKDIDESAPVIVNLCRANEVCNSFSDCVCDENCGANSSSAQEKWLVIGEEEVDNLTMDGTFFSGLVLGGNEWLSRTSGEAIDDLPPTTLFPVFQKGHSTNSDGWLLNSTNSNTSQVGMDSCPFADHMARLHAMDSAIWLRKAEPTPNNPSGDYKPYSSSIVTDMWLKTEENQEACLPFVFTHHFPETKASNPWLRKSSTSNNCEEESLVKFPLPHTEKGGLDHWLLRNEEEAVSGASLKENRDEDKVENLKPKETYDNRDSGIWLLKSSMASCDNVLSESLFTQLKYKTTGINEWLLSTNLEM